MSDIQATLKIKKKEAKDKLKATAQHLQYKAAEQVPRTVKIAMERKMHLMQKKFTKESPPSGNSNILYKQSGVFLHTGSGDDDTTDTIPGTLYLYEKPEGQFIEWKPLGEASVSSDGEWDLVEPKAVSFHTGPSDEANSVSIEHPIRHQHIVHFDLRDLKSMRRTKRHVSWSYVIFILNDGRTFPPLHFHSGGSKELKHHLQASLNLVRSRTDTELFVVEQHDPDALKRSFHELELFPDQKQSLVQRFAKNPYVTTLTGFSKVSSLMRDYLLAPEAGETQVAPVDLLSADLGAVELTTLQEEAGYQVISKRQLPPRPAPILRGDPLSHKQWRAALDAEGRIAEPGRVKQIIFRGGVDPELRRHVWPFQLGYFSWDSTEAERQVFRKQRTDDYYAMKLQWRTISEEQARRNSRFRENRNLVDKDVLRTDRTFWFYEGENNKNLDKLRDILMTYCMYDADLGYVQGMSDLLSPLLVVLEDEVDSFWCFVGFMNLVGRNFEMDQMHMKKQLANLRTLLEFTEPVFCNYLQAHESSNMFFCFRWLLILFKREFSLADAMRLWEVYWTGLPCQNFQLLICLAILEQEKTTLMDNKFGFTEILKHVNDLSLQISVSTSLSQAESLYAQLAACSRLPLEIAMLLGLEPGAAQSSDEEVQQEGLGLVRQSEPPPRPPLPRDVTLKQTWPGSARPCSVEADYVIASAEVSPQPADLDSSIEVLSEES